jgi:uncharacterized protein YbaA (DUF1428 family)
MYVDGFLLPVPKSKVEHYLRLSRKAGKIFKRLGAVEYRESVADDLGPHPGMGTSFRKSSRAKPGETVVFSWIVYRNKAQRDRVNKKMMKDPAMLRLMQDPNAMPFDVKRMNYGGFTLRVDL